MEYFHILFFLVNVEGCGCNGLSGIVNHQS